VKRILRQNNTKGLKANRLGPSCFSLLRGKSLTALWAAALLLVACAHQSQPAVVVTVTLPAPAVATVAPVTATLAPTEPAATLTAAPVASPTAAISPTPEFDPFAADLPLADIAYSIPPAFQRVAEDSADLYFALEPEAAGTVFYRSAETGVQSVAFEQAAGAHVVTLPGLRPATTYDVLVTLGMEPDYRLPMFLDEAWGAQTITTPPYSEPLRFASIADSGFGDPTTAALAARIAAQSPDFVLLPGDVVYRIGEQGSAAEAWRLKYFKPFAPILHHSAIFPALGNHELDEPGVVGGMPYYYTAFPPVFDTTFPAPNGDPLRKWYAFSYSGIQFLSLDTQTLFGDSGRAEQDAWLADRLADSNYAYTIVFFHVPPYSSSQHRFDGPRVRGWADQFEAAGIPLVISGHDHVYERLAHGGTTYIVSGGGSATIYPLFGLNENSQFFASVSHYTWYEAYPDRIEEKAIGVDGTLIDQATIPVPQ
jgi:Calcineurin-like phosphoesterase